MRIANNRKWTDEKVVKLCQGGGLLFCIGRQRRLLYLPAVRKKNRASQAG